MVMFCCIKSSRYQVVQLMPPDRREMREKLHEARQHMFQPTAHVSFPSYWNKLPSNNFFTLRLSKVDGYPYTCMDYSFQSGCTFHSLIGRILIQAKRNTNDRSKQIENNSFARWTTLASPSTCSRAVSVCATHRIRSAHSNFSVDQNFRQKSIIDRYINGYDENVILSRIAI